MTYLEEIEEIIKTHPEIPQAVVFYVIHRVNDYLEMEYTSQYDTYLFKNLTYLKRWI